MMKRTSLALFLSSLLSASAFATSAQAPSLKINGYTNVGIVSANQQRTDNGKGGSATHVQHNCSDLYFTVSGLSSSGVEYKYLVNLEALPGSSAYVNKNYVQFSGEFGTVQLGSLKGAENAMITNGLSLVGGADSLDGAFPNVFNYASGTIDGVDPVGYTNKAGKVSFYSPVVNGFQLGVSFTPNTSTWGRDAKQHGRPGNYIGKGSDNLYYDSRKAPYGKNNVAVGLKYDGEQGDWTYGAAVVTIRESSQLAKDDGTQGRTTLRNANSYVTSAHLGYGQMKFAGGYLDNRKSRIPVSAIAIGEKEKAVNYAGMNEGNAGNAWNFGGEYTYGPYQFALVYFQSNRKTDATSKATNDVVTASVDLLALQGLKFFGEVDFITSRTNDNAKAVRQAYLDSEKKGDKALGNNSGTVFVLGTKLSF